MLKTKATHLHCIVHLGRGKRQLGREVGGTARLLLTPLGNYSRQFLALDRRVSLERVTARERERYREGEGERESEAGRRTT